MASNLSRMTARKYAIRVGIAFAVAPLWVPLIVAPYSARYLFPYPGQHLWILLSITMSAGFTYLGTIILGLPAFLVLPRYHCTAFWFAPGIGFLTGGVVMLAFRVCFSLALGDNVGVAISAGRINLGQTMTLFAVGGLLGTLVGSTLWVIARPDRKTRRELVRESVLNRPPPARSSRSPRSRTRRSGWDCGTRTWRPGG